MSGFVPPTITLTGFSDESSWNQNRYRSIGLVTATTEIANKIRQTVSNSLNESGISELAWKNLRGANHRVTVNKIIDTINKMVCSGKLRIDVLIWDTQDSRHDIQGRNDTTNLARMYYHIMSNVMRERWPDDANWMLHVDKRSDLDWTELKQCLSGKTRRERRSRQTHFFQGSPTPRAMPIVEQVSSQNHPLIQVADLFAGLAAFSWNESLTHIEWQERKSDQLDLFPSNEGKSISNSANYKHQVLSHLIAHDLGYTSFKANKKEGLKTYSPSHPINFWFYTPQGDYDKAPRRNKK